MPDDLDRILDERSRVMGQVYAKLWSAVGAYEVHYKLTQPEMVSVLGQLTNDRLNVLLNSLRAAGKLPDEPG